MDGRKLAALATEQGRNATTAEETEAELAATEAEAAGLLHLVGRAVVPLPCACGDPAVGYAVPPLPASQRRGIPACRRFLVYLHGWHLVPLDADVEPFRSIGR